MCVYYSSNNKAINAKNSLNHSRYLSNAGNKVQSLNIFFFLKLEYTTFAFLFFFFLPFNMGTYNNAHINIIS